MTRKPSNIGTPHNARQVNVQWIQVDRLFLDPKNPRMAQLGLDEESTQEEILCVLWRNVAVDEVAFSIAANGYFPHEELFASKESGHLVVIEGNRRLAAVKLLLSEELRRRCGASDLPSINETRRSELQRLPVIECSRRQVWSYLGFKHVNGPQPWDSYSKAQYIAMVHDDMGISLQEIALTIGDRHATVQRLYRGLMVMRQAEQTRVFDPEDRWAKHFSFSHLYTGLDYPGFQQYLGIDPQQSFAPNPVPSEKLGNLGELCMWLYGNKRKDKMPLVRSQNPDLKLLDEVLRSVDGTSALRQGLPLSTSVNISRGDDRLFREALVQAKESLEEARAKLLTGYHGESDLLKRGNDIFLLAKSIHTEMKKRFEKVHKSKGDERLS